MLPLILLLTLITTPDEIGIFTCTYDASQPAAVCKLNNKQFTIQIDWRDPYFDEWQWQAFTILTVSAATDKQEPQLDYNHRPERARPVNGATLYATFDKDGVFEPVANCGVRAVREYRRRVSDAGGDRVGMNFDLPEGCTATSN